MLRKISIAAFVASALLLEARALPHFGSARNAGNNNAGCSVASAKTVTATVTVSARGAAATAATATTTLAANPGKGAIATNVNTAAPAATGNSGRGGRGGRGGKGTTSTAGELPTTSLSSLPAGATANTAATTGGSTGDIQSSLILDPSVIAKGFLNNGQDNATAGQVASLTSPNNFINFCATVPQLPISNGQQVKTGSCNPAPMGVIASTNNMPTCRFRFPLNFGTIKANTAFNIELVMQHLQTGSFTNAQETYFAAPQQVNAAGDIIGHTHVVVQALTSLAQTTPADPATFAFFKGVNNAADGSGLLTVPVTAGLPAGVYKLSTINSAANHQPVLVAIAQHGALNDAIYFTVTNDGQAAGGAGTTTTTSTTAQNGRGGKGAKTTAAAATTTTAAAAAKTTAAAASTGGANFGKCSTPQIKFAFGLDGRTEAAFQAVDQKSFNHGSAQGIDVISGFICQQLVTPCGANAAAQALCKQASAAADAAPARTGRQADAFNAVFGITTAFAKVGA